MYMYIDIYVYIYIQVNSAVSNVGYNGCPYRISNVSSFPFGLLCLNEHSDVKNPRHIERISVSVECSKQPGSTVSLFIKSDQGNIYN